MFKVFFEIHLHAQTLVEIFLFTEKYLKVSYDVPNSPDKYTIAYIQNKHYTANIYKRAFMKKQKTSNCINFNHKILF